ncbi:MAG: ZIP family metal transporter [Oscillospiraceae bacterium]
MLHALALTTLAGLSTGLGGLVVMLCKKPGDKMMSLSLGFAAGVMITVSLTDMLPHTVHVYHQYMPIVLSALASASLAAMGMIIAMLLEKCIPGEKELAASHITGMTHAAAMRSAIVTTAAIVLHNLPEGVLTLFTGYASPRLGAALTLAIAMHNIPEGIAIAVPVYYATGSKIKAAVYALLSGVAEPLGAVLAFFVFRNAITPGFLNGLVASISGIMLYVSASELLPESFAFGKRGYSILGIVGGIIIMSIGIYLV